MAGHRNSLAKRVFWDGMLQAVGHCRAAGLYSILIGRIFGPGWVDWAGTTHLLSEPSQGVVARRRFGLPI